MFAQLDGLGAAAGAQLVEGPAAVGFDGVLADEKAVGDLAVAESLSDKVEDFELARSDAEGVELGLVQGEGGLLGWRGGGDEDFAEDDLFPWFGELDAQPDAEGGEEDGDNGAIDFEGVLDDQELVLGPAEDGDEDAADEAEKQDVAEDGALHVCWVDFTACPMPEPVRQEILISMAKSSGPAHRTVAAPGKRLAITHP